MVKYGGQGRDVLEEYRRRMRPRFPSIKQLRSRWHFNMQRCLLPLRLVQNWKRCYEHIPCTAMASRDQNYASHTLLTSSLSAVVPETGHK